MVIATNTPLYAKSAVALKKLPRRAVHITNEVVGSKLSWSKTELVHLPNVGGLCE